ncbi:Hypothetical protein SMAX5B_007984 [Scophthalmus maximus]|uniref:Uncharacterized protein n=1 Tax=Scophthalmus maximus TaxID=52904 RepID=A0A2U9BBH1_SCOMX|nr:Hypothetical protein SMAX5B_007984 [Scophthalmus maximus]
MVLLPSRFDNVKETLKEHSQILWLQGPPVPVSPHRGKSSSLSCDCCSASEQHTDPSTVSDHSGPHHVFPHRGQDEVVVVPGAGLEGGRPLALLVQNLPPTPSKTDAIDQLFA